MNWYSVLTGAPSMLRVCGRGVRSGRPAATGDGHGVGDDLVDEAVLHGLLGREPAVAVGVGGDLLKGLAGLLGGQLGEHPLHVQDELGIDPDVGRGAADAAGRLVHHHPRVRGGVTLALGTRGEQELPHRCGHADRHRRDVGLDVLHRVVDRHARGDRAARGVDVQVDVLVRVLGGQQHHLRADRVGVLVPHLGAQPDDPLAQQPVVDVVVQAQARTVTARVPPELALDGLVHGSPSFASSVLLADSDHRRRLDISCDPNAARRATTSRRDGFSLTAQCVVPLPSGPVGPTAGGWHAVTRGRAGRFGRAAASAQACSSAATSGSGRSWGAGTDVAASVSPSLPMNSDRSTTSPAGSTTRTRRNATAVAFDRPTSATIAGICPCWSTDWMKALGSIPYWLEALTRYSNSSSWLTWTARRSARVSSRIRSASEARVSASTSARCASSSNRPSDSRCRWISSSTTPAGSGTSALARSCSSNRSLACTARLCALIRPTCSRRSARSSARVSNSLASSANSSSAAGRSRSLTDIALTVTWAVSPACSPPASGAWKVVVSPAERPLNASSRPSSRFPEPIW